MKELSTGCLILGILFVVITVGGIFLTGLGLAGKLAWFPIHTAQKEIQLGYDIQDKTLDADNAVYNYEYFKSTFETINATKAQLDNATIAFDTFKKEAGDRKDWTFEDKTESARLASVELGLRNNLEQIIADYNAKSKMANRNIFKDKLVPDYIDALKFVIQK